MKTIGFLGVAHIHTALVSSRASMSAVPSLMPKRFGTASRRARKSPPSSLLARRLTDYREILNDGEIEAVIICSETSLHLELVEATAAARKDVFVEKPLGMGAR